MQDDDTKFSMKIKQILYDDNKFKMMIKHENEDNKTQNHANKI